MTAKWYRAGATHAVVYEGLDPAAPACPGNSAQTTAGFDFVSNAPMPEGDCGTFPTAIDSDATQGVQLCGDRVSYLTVIPSDYIAVLFSSIERPIEASGVGVTGFVLVEDPSTLPEIDPPCCRVEPAPERTLWSSSASSRASSSTIDSRPPVRDRTPSLTECQP